MACAVRAATDDGIVTRTIGGATWSSDLPHYFHHLIHVALCVDSVSHQGAPNGPSRSEQLPIRSRGRMIVAAE
jgi:hypothetical protein